MWGTFLESLARSPFLVTILTTFEREGSVVIGSEGTLLSLEESSDSSAWVKSLSKRPYRRPYQRLWGNCTWTSTHFCGKALVCRLALYFGWKRSSWLLDHSYFFLQILWLIIVIWIKVWNVSLCTVGRKTRRVLQGSVFQGLFVLWREYHVLHPFLDFPMPSSASSWLMEQSKCLPLVLRL